ncbi:MAG TPA: CoA pyrophosphatase [Deltaproteobacteria bacterium]|nr:CoA pyrophosphatase [Deltaproteobacteria bacterium]
MNHIDINDKEQVLARIRTRLARIDAEYSRRVAVIRSYNRNGQDWRPAGVLIPLYYKKNIEGGGGGFVLQLIRRSAAVKQSGDISGPGGMLAPRLDRVLRLPLRLGVTPIFRGLTRTAAKQKGNAEFSAVSLFLANALRESWEEIGLNPLNVDFLGPLPCQDLLLMTKTIFPVAGHVKREWKFRPNEEVERVVEIPLADFFRKDSYGMYCVDNSFSGKSPPFTTPCLIRRGHGDEEDILWGATLRIMMDFLRIVFNFVPPENGDGRVIRKIISAEYLASNGKSGKPAARASNGTRERRP